MRTSFFKTIGELAERRDDVVVLTGDLGFKLFDDFKSKHPNMFYNIGVAEADMIGIAAGLSLSGENVYCYSIIPFLIMRAFEQIRIDIAYNNLNVKLVGFGSGFTYGLEGFTHYALEDLALMRILPNMTVVIPADSMEAISLAKSTIEYKGPMYIRLGRANESFIHNKPFEFKIGCPIILNEGKEVAIFAIGNMVYVAKQVVDKLKQDGIKATLINMHTLKPLNREFVRQVGLVHQVIFSIEEHYINGGLGSSIAEVLADSDFKGKFRRIGIPEKLGRYVGNADYLRNKYGLTVENIYKRILKGLKEE